MHEQLRLAADVSGGRMGTRNRWRSVAVVHVFTDGCHLGESFGVTHGPTKMNFGHAIALSGLQIIAITPNARTYRTPNDAEHDDHEILG